MLQWFRKSASYMMPTSIAGRAAAVTAFLLLITVGVAQTYLIIRGNRLDWKVGTVVAVLIPIISGLAYAIVRFWGEVEQSLYPDIDTAWIAGVRALHNVGMSLTHGTEPLFLILGSGEVETAFADHMQAAGQEFRVKGVPAGAGEAPSLRWYATADAIFLFVSDVGALSTLARDWSKCSHEQQIDWGESLLAGQLTSQLRAAVSSRLTMTYQGEDLDDDSSMDSSVRQPPPPRAPAKSVQLPTEVDFNRQYERISYLSNLIRRARHPRCGVNGVALLMPFELTVANRNDLSALVQAIRNDLQAIHVALSLRIPVFGLVTGMQQAVGFNEFANQVGREKALESRLGSGFSVHSWATGERLQWLSDRICDAFEDFTYGLFAQPDALNAPEENCKLYHLLCRFRQRIKPQLNQVLVPAFKNSGGLGGTGVAARDEGLSAVYFGGCYLAATGPTPEEGQAFVTGVLFKKLKEHEHHVEWTEKALRAKRRFKAAVWTGWVVLGALLVLLLMAFVR